MLCAVPLSKHLMVLWKAQGLLNARPIKCLKAFLKNHVKTPPKYEIERDFLKNKGKSVRTNAFSKKESMIKQRHVKIRQKQ